MKATPTLEDITDLADRRSDASVMISLPTSPVASEVERLRLEYKNAMKDADRQLEAAEVETDVRTTVREALEEVAEGEFWTRLSRGAIIFASPGFSREFRVPTAVPSRVAVGDRFDIGPLLRSSAFARTGYVLALNEGGARLASISADVGPTEIPLDLPDDLHTVLEHADNSGSADMHRAQGATGDKVELRKFSRIVHEAVVKAINGREAPLVLAAANDLLSAYRDANTYSQLLEECIDVNPSSLSLQDLEEKARSVLQKDYEQRLGEWRETFGTRLNHGRASVDVNAIARAASVGAVEELLFDVADESEGVIDPDGDITPAPVAGAHTSGIFDEIAVRVMRMGGRVRAVRRSDLPGKQGIAAMLRFDPEGDPDSSVG